MPRADWKIVSQMLVSLPGREEQAKIASVFENYDAQIADHNKTIDRLRTQKKSLMQQLLTGKRRVSV